MGRAYLDHAFNVLLGSRCTGTELCERIGSLGLQRNLVTYFTKKMHLSNPVAANMVSNFTGALYLTPFLGGFIADAYLGRFWVIVVFSVIQIFVSFIHDRSSSPGVSAPVGIRFFPYLCHLLIRISQSCIFV